MTYDSFSVDCYDGTDTGGKWFVRRAEADDFFDRKIKSGGLASVILYGWMGNGNFVVLRSWAENEGAMVHIDTDNEEWGRVCSDGVILDDFGNTLLIEVETIRANILVPREDVAF